VVSTWRKRKAMADPFRVLRTPLVPVEPDPVFASRLRSRLERALRLPKGVTVSDLTLEEPGIETYSTQRLAARAVVTPYLAVRGAREAVAWYEQAFGARLVGNPYEMPDGRIGHAELDVAGGLVMLSEEHPEIGVVAPEPDAGASVTLHLNVDDVDTVMGRALSAGATLERAAADYEYGRNGVIRDPFGHRWLVSSEPVAQSLRHGDIGYASLFVRDLGRASAFFSEVLGWRFAPGSSDQGVQVEGQNPHHGIWGDQERGTLFLCFAVRSVAEAVLRVRDAGGTASEAHAEPYGLISDCFDDQGTAFALFEPPGGLSGAASGPRRSAARHGDLVYVTMEVVDSERARAFYGSVLEWDFTAGRVEDGWQVEDVAPMTGMSGGHDLCTVVPMYQVDDIDAAVRKVRASGGTATDPETQPYGATSSCTDDQGTRFYLGQT
jgi:uncharacterized glyoxalase superfamily protein PhnB